MKIEARAIKKSYNGEMCLKGVDLTVEEGQFLSIMGASGSGKTTLLEILAGVRLPDEGEVYIGGENICSLSPQKMAKMRRTALGFVYQNFSLVSTLTAKDNIRLPLALEKRDKALFRERLDELSEGLNLTHSLLDKYPDELSGGQQQRVALARALIYRPQVLFLDEPTGSLDRENTERVLRLLEKYNRRYNATVVQITHSQWAAAFVGGEKNVVRISDGVLLR